jgi:hypothetical protein
MRLECERQRRKASIVIVSGFLAQTDHVELPIWMLHRSRRDSTEVNMSWIGK